MRAAYALLLWLQSAAGLQLGALFGAKPKRADDLRGLSSLTLKGVCAHRWARTTDDAHSILAPIAKAFEDLKGTRRKPGGREPESMDWMLRWRKVLDTIEAAFIAHKKDIDVSTLYPVPLTPAEWDGEATVPVEPSQVGELGIGAWGSSSSEDSDSDAPPKVNPRDQWSCLNDPANIWLLSRPESEVLGPQNHGESR